MWGLTFWATLVQEVLFTAEISEYSEAYLVLYLIFRRVTFLGAKDGERLTTQFHLLLK
jgi:hypothetical protein